METRTTKKQRDNLFNCHIGVGFLSFRSGKNELKETEFFIKNGVPCYLGNGKPVEFIFYPEEDED